MIFKSALIVDDSKLARITLRKKLSSYGLSVELAESGKEALAVIQANKPDIIFLDHLMPEMDGFEAAGKIRGLPEFSNTPIIMCTGKEHDGYLEEAQAIGANQILSKPPVDEALEKILNTQFDMVASSVAAIDIPSIAPPIAEDAVEIDLSDDLSFDLADDIADIEDSLGNFDDIDVSSISLEDELLSSEDVSSSVVQPVADIGDLSDLGTNVFNGGHVPDVSVSVPENEFVAGIDESQVTAMVNAEIAKVKSEFEQKIHVIQSSVDAQGQQVLQPQESSQAEAIELTKSVFQEEKVGLVADVIAAMPAEVLSGNQEKSAVVDMSSIEESVKSLVTDQVQSLRDEITEQIQMLSSQLGQVSEGESGLTIDDVKLVVQAEVNEKTAQLQSVDHEAVAIDDDRLQQLEAIVAQQLAANKAATEGLINEALDEMSLGEQNTPMGNQGLAEQVELISEQQQRISTQQQLPKNLSSIAVALAAGALLLSAYLFVR